MKTGPWRRRLLSAIVAPVLFLLACELILRLVSFGYDPRFFVPVPGRGMMTGNPQFGRRFFPAELTQPPTRFVFPARKAPGTCRIFVLGSSAAAGIPSVAYNFGRILQVMLEESFPGRKFEVINTAMVAINSHVVREIARECARYEPDLFVVYMGNNEVIGPYGPGTIFDPINSLPFIRMGVRAHATRVGQLMGWATGSASFRKSEYKSWQGMEMFMGRTVGSDDPRLQAVCRHLARNLEDICGMARRGGADVVLCTVATNLRDCPPFASLHAKGFAGERQARWEKELLRGSVAAEHGQWKDAADAYAEAAGIDGSHAELQFRLGQCLLKLDQPGEARKRFVMARDSDALRFRADTSINQVIRDTAGRIGASLADAESALAEPSLSPNGLPGDELFYEHCHLTFAGNYHLATSAFRSVAGLISGREVSGPSQPPDPPSLDACAERLAWTEWDRCQAEDRILHMMDAPPFTGQFGHAARYAGRRMSLENSEKALTPQRLAAVRDTYERAAARTPDDVLLQLNFADLLTRLKAYPAAEPHWRRAVEILPQDPELHFDLGTALLRVGNPSESEAELRAALRLRPAHAETHANLAVALSAQGRVDGAIAELREALRCNPGYASAHANLAKLLMSKGAREEAKGHAEAAARAGPQDK